MKGPHMQLPEIPVASLSSVSTIGPAMRSPAAEACCDGSCEAARAKPSTRSLRQFFLVPSLPAAP